MKTEIVGMDNNTLILHTVIKLDKRGRCSIYLPKGWVVRNAGKKVRVKVEVIEDGT